MLCTDILLIATNKEHNCLMKTNANKVYLYSLKGKAAVSIPLHENIELSHT